MKVIIRIAGEVGLRKDVAETLYRLKLRKKYSCVVLEKLIPEQLGMVKKVRDFIAYGDLDEKTYKKLKEKRKTKIDNFFRLHPPRGGIKTKLHFPEGVLGDHKEKINELIEKML